MALIDRQLERIRRTEFKVASNKYPFLAGHYLIGFRQKFVKIKVARRFRLTLSDEAGGVVSDIRGGSQHLESGNVVAGGIKLHHEMVTAIRPHVPDDMRA